MREKISGICRLEYFLVVILALIPRSLWAGVAPTESANGVENLIRVHSSGSGSVVIYDGLKKVLSIEPQVFSADGKFLPFKASGKDSHSQWAAKLPNGGKIFLDTSMQILKSGVHICYTLVPNQLVKDFKIRACAYFHYADWMGDSYQVGSIHGIFPNPAPKLDIAHEDTNFLEMGPTHTHQGLTASFTSEKIPWVLQYSAEKKGSLIVWFMSKGSNYEHSEWEAGGKQVLNFEVSFNRNTISDSSKNQNK